MAKIATRPDVRAQLLEFAEDFDAEAAKLDLATAGDTRASTERSPGNIIPKSSAT